MQIDSSLHSANFSSRNLGQIEMLVFHATAGTRRSDIPTLLGQTSRRVSAHYYITKEGHVYQFVADQYAAWHAGVSGWKGHGSGWIQDSSIGIEMENWNNGRDPYPAVQYQAAKELAKMLIAKYHIQPDMLVRHLDIALPIGRKTDPAGFPWVAFRQDVLSSSGPANVQISTLAEAQSDTQNKAPDQTEAVVPSFWTLISDAFNRFLDGLR